MRKLLLLGLGCLFVFGQLLAQQSRTVTGKVTDDKGLPIQNASVTIKGSAIGTTTDATGSFKLTVPESAKVLVISSVGMAPQELTIGGKTDFTVSLQTTEQALQEVVV